MDACMLFWTAEKWGYVIDEDVDLEGMVDVRYQQISKLYLEDEPATKIETGMNLHNHNIAKFFANHHYFLYRLLYFSLLE